MMLRFAGLALLLASGVPAQTITVRAGTLLDGKGGVQKNVRLIVQGPKIVRVDSGGEGRRLYDLASLTVMPGWIDTHVHINGHFNEDGRADTKQRIPG